MTNIFDSMRTGMINSIIDSFSGFDQYLSDSYTALTANVFSGNWATIANSISGIIKPTATMICGICFLIEFLKITINGDVIKYEYLIRVFAKLCIAKASIDISTDALKLVFTTVSKWITQVSTDTITVGSQLATSAQTTLNDSNFGEVFAIWLSSCLFIFFLKIIGIMINVMGYARSFELTCVNSVAPLPFAFLCLDDGMGSGSRTFKNFAFVYIAICLRGLFMVISLSLFCKLAGSISFSDWTSGLSDLLVLSLVLLMALVKSDQWAGRLLTA